MASRLPAFPRFVFTVFEPLSLLSGSIPALLWPDWFIKEQLDKPAHLNSENALTIAQQLGNVYGLLFMLGVVVLYTSSELKVVRNYLVALLIADLGHIGVTYYVLQYDKFIAVGDWNPMTWGNVGVTAFLFLTRTAYLTGLFGPDASPAAAASKKRA